MASKRGQRRKQCGNKKRLTREEAHRMAQHLNRTQMTTHHVDAYQCKHGDHWHVGHRPRRVQQAISARMRDRKRKDGT